MMPHLSSIVISLDSGAYGIFLTELAFAMGYWVLFFWFGLYLVWMFASHGVFIFLSKRINLALLLFWLSSGAFGLSAL